MPTTRRSSRHRLTEHDLGIDGPPVRLSDLMAITGWSRDTLIRAADSGHLPAIRLTHLPKAPYYFHRHEVRAWLVRIGWTQSAA